MTGAVGNWLDDRRLHLQHGPIDLVIEAHGMHGHSSRKAYEAATRRFRQILGELVDELPSLRSRHSRGSGLPMGSVARRMHNAVRFHSDRMFITPMAAVAGAVADEVLFVMKESVELARAYVNNGGDIAVHLAEGEEFRVAIANRDGDDLGRVRIVAGQRIGGVATSGRGGRSLTMGISDSVTVLAGTAASADAAATVIANAVDLPGHPGISRVPASEIDDGSDLGDMPVVTGCAALDADEIRLALGNGARVAERLCKDGQIIAAALYLQGVVMSIGPGSEILERIDGSGVKDA